MAETIDANKWAEYDKCIAIEAQSLTLTCLKSINKQKVWEEGIPTSAINDMSAAIERLQNVAFHAKNLRRRSRLSCLYRHTTQKYCRLQSKYLSLVYNLRRCFYEYL